MVEGARTSEVSKGWLVHVVTPMGGGGGHECREGQCGRFWDQRIADPEVWREGLGLQD